MTTRVTIDKAGRIVIPKSVRDELCLEPGDTLELEAHGQEVSLRPVRSKTALSKERGVWVFRSGRKLSSEEANRALRKIRAQRDNRTQDET